MKRFGVTVCILSLALSCQAQAEDPVPSPQPFAQFSFKRVKPPSADTAKRITIQIAPNEPAAVADDDTTTDPATTALPMAGFWSAVSPALADGGPGRLHDALFVLAGLPAADAPTTPRLQPMQAIVQTHGTDILVATIGTRVSPALVLSVISVESSGRSGAVSEKGALGLMQLIPATAERFGVDPDVDSDNIKGGVAYLDWLLNKFDGDPMLALAAYNAGENAVLDHDGVPPYAETRAYVPKVLAAWSVARNLCATPPELISDGCVFAVDKAG